MRRPKEPQYCNSIQRSVAVSMRRELLDLCSRYLMAGRPSLSGPDVHELEGIRLKVEAINRKYSEIGEPLLDLDIKEAGRLGKKVRRAGKMMEWVSGLALFGGYFANFDFAVIPSAIGFLAGAAIDAYSKVFSWVEMCDSAAKEALAEAKRLSGAALPEIQRRAVDYYQSAHIWNHQ